MSLQTGKTIPVRSKCCKATMKMSKIGEKPNWVMCTACGQDCDIEANCDLCHFEPENGHGRTCPNRKELPCKDVVHLEKYCKFCKPTSSKGWEERFRKSFGQFYADVTGRVDFVGVKSVGSKTIEDFISQEIESAYNRGRDEEAIGCYEHCEDAKREERERIIRVIEKMMDTIQGTWKLASASSKSAGLEVLANAICLINLNDEKDGK